MVKTWSGEFWYISGLLFIAHLADGLLISKAFVGKIISTVPATCLHWISITMLGFISVLDFISQFWISYLSLVIIPKNNLKIALRPTGVLLVYIDLRGLAFREPFGAHHIGLVIKRVLLFLCSFGIYIYLYSALCRGRHDSLPLWPSVPQVLPALNITSQCIYILFDIFLIIVQDMVLGFCKKNNTD